MDHSRLFQLQFEAVAFAEVFGGELVCPALARDVALLRVFVGPLDRASHLRLDRVGFDREFAIGDLDVPALHRRVGGRARVVDLSVRTIPLLTMPVVVFAVVALVVSLDLLDPQPAASSAAAQASATSHVDWRSVTRHFLTGAELSAAELDALLDRAIELKDAPLSSRALAGRGVALIFEKPSTRTRLSFEMGVYELGGHAVVLRSEEMQLSRGESPRDTALVLSRQVAAVGMRTGPDSLLDELAEHAQSPCSTCSLPCTTPARRLPI